MNASFDEKYYLPASGDTTDMTAAIEEKLNSEGACLLGCGNYYVKEINMPVGTSLIGMGAATRLILMPEVEKGYTVRINSFCTVRDMSILGSEELLPKPKELGERCGIAFIGTATHENSKGQPRNAIISGCQINSFSGSGIFCLNTGYHTTASITASDCHIVGCGVGINIHHHSEYHEFTNILCSTNLYGCINNGGNNVFVNCGFNSNTTGFVIDNSRGQSLNDSHGSMVGCTINHPDANKGIGLLLLGVRCGYVFSGGQIFYSKVVCKDCSGVHITGFNFGRNTEFEITGGDPVLLTNSIFAAAPSFTVADGGRIIIRDCYNRMGDAVEV